MVTRCQIQTKLRTYVLLKAEFKVEDYLLLCLNRSKRSLMAQLRCGILPLRIEVGRYQNIKDGTTGRYRKLKPEERLCMICNDNLVEDEIHFICECVKYNEIREELFYSAFIDYMDFHALSSKEKFIYLLLHNVKETCQYIEKAWNIRKNCMFT